MTDFHRKKINLSHLSMVEFYNLLIDIKSHGFNLHSISYAECLNFYINIKLCPSSPKATQMHYGRTKRKKVSSNSLPFVPVL
jgi:hypothetical protein